MNTFLRIDINILAFILLVLVIIIAYQQLELQDSLNRLFLRIARIILHILIIETATCIINRRPELWLIPITNVLHILLFVLAPISTCYWYYLIRKLIFPEESVSMPRKLLYVIPLVVNGIMTVLSPVYHFIFYIDGSNVYHRGSLYLVSAAITYVYIIGAFLTAIRFRKKLPKQDANLLMIFIGFPIAGALVQTFLYGPLLIWSCSAFALVIAYAFLQQRMVHLDDLTGAWDRRSFDYYIVSRLEQSYERFGAVYVDVDRLKEINDTYGHLEGDYAIKTAVDIIRNEVRKNDIIVRMGGDEFLIVINCDSKEDLYKTIERIETAFVVYNKNSKKEYRLECSFGADMFDSQYSSFEQFLNHIDNLMYCNKNKKKAALNNCI